jgi:hypothetical protein
VVPVRNGGGRAGGGGAGRVRAVAWRDPRPAACRAGPSAGMQDNAGLGIAADGSLAVASFGCGPAVIVQRLDVTTGRPLRSWTSPAAHHAAVHLPVTAAARGGVVLLTGEIGPQAAAARFTARLPHPYPWPAHLGPADGTSIVLALDAADGHPRWSELGGQQVRFAPAEGAVCELVTAGLECRDDATGAATTARTTGWSRRCRFPPRRRHPGAHQSCRPARRPGSRAPYLSVAAVADLGAARASRLVPRARRGALRAGRVRVFDCGQNGKHRPGSSRAESR